MGYQKYSDEDKAEALASLKSNGDNISRTSQELGIPWATLACWFKGTREVGEGVTKLQEEKETELSAICERVARKYLNQAEDPWAIAITPGNVAMTAAAIAIDKMQLLRGQPTAITKAVDFLITKLTANSALPEDVTPDDIRAYLGQNIEQISDKLQ